MGVSLVTGPILYLERVGGVRGIGDSKDRSGRRGEPKAIGAEVLLVLKRIG